MISQVSSLSLSAASAAPRETDRSRYRASGSAVPGTRSNVSAAAQTSGSRHTGRPFEVPRGRFANTVSSRSALSCSINSALTPVCTSSARNQGGCRGGHRARRRRRAVARQGGDRQAQRRQCRHPGRHQHRAQGALAPIRQIAENLGVEGSIVVGKVLENKSQTWGFDALTEQYVDMLNAASLIRRRWCGSPCRTLRRSPVL
jgi:hypothetical protein